MDFPVNRVRETSHKFQIFLTCKVKFHPFVEFNLAKSHIPKGGI